MCDIKYENDEKYQTPQKYILNYLYRLLWTLWKCLKAICTCTKNLRNLKEHELMRK